MDLKERTIAMRKVLSDLMGDTPEDEKNEFWMNMAMLSFAVAAGESPDALKNIAKGMLEGTAQIQQGKTAKKKRSDDITLASITQAASAQEGALDRESRERIAAMGASGSQFRNLRNPEEFRQNIYNDSFTAFIDGPIPPKNAKPGETAVEYATRMADEAYAYAMNTLPEKTDVSAADAAADAAKKLGLED
jgi:hypothetical protein